MSPTCILGPCEGWGHTMCYVDFQLFSPAPSFNSALLRNLSDSQTHGLAQVVKGTVSRSHWGLLVNRPPFYSINKQSKKPFLFSTSHHLTLVFH